MTDAPLTVLVLGGGPDAERDVSLKSAAAVANALREAGHRVIESDVGPDDTAALDAGNFDVVFPALHGPFGEGGPLQRLLAERGLRFVGCAAPAAEAAMDKAHTKRLAAARGVPTPESQVIGSADALSLEPPLVLKPLDEGSSVDVAICSDAAAVADALSRLLRRHDRLLAERFVAGREMTVGILDGEALPIIEIVPADGAYDYDAKYLRNDTEYRFDFQAPAEHLEVMRRHAQTVHRALNARHLSRVDFLLDERGPWLLEINTMPGFTDHSLLPMAAARAGMPMPALCDRLVRLAQADSTP